MKMFDICKQLIKNIIKKVQTQLNGCEIQIKQQTSKM